MSRNIQSRLEFEQEDAQSTTTRYKELVEAESKEVERFRLLDKELKRTTVNLNIAEKELQKWRKLKIEEVQIDSY